VNAPPRRPQGWKEFVAKVAELAAIEPDRIGPKTRIVEDLGLDSIALAELVVLLIDDYGVEPLSAGLEQRTWEGVTVGSLFDESRDAAAPTQRTVRLPAR
jgi:acyl carrier protein